MTRVCCVSGQRYPVKSGEAEITRCYSKRETFEALASSSRPGGFFDLYFGAHKYNVRIVHQRVFHTIVIFYIAILGAWSGDLRVVIVRRGRSESEGLKVALRVATLPS
jgi:hypothetical protein